METANNLSVAIKEVCNNVQSKFYDLFRRTEQLVEDIIEKIKIPRVTQFHQRREKYELISAEITI